MKILKWVFGLVIVFGSVIIPLQVLNGKVVFTDVESGTFGPEQLYRDLQLKELGLDFNVFKIAMEGHNKLVQQNKLEAANLVTIVDLAQPSINKRLYVVDLLKHKVLFNTYVSHGKNSGELYATHFSNRASSLQSSLGFYITGPIYNGKHGMSLKLIGQEQGFNDQALERAIVLHGADYVSENFIKATGRLGRSFGCPAVATELAAPIIKTIQDGSCLFVYYPDASYLKKSVFACAAKSGNNN